VRTLARPQLAEIVDGCDSNNLGIISRRIVAMTKAIQET
jgi:hypothetical protein